MVKPSISIKISSSLLRLLILIVLFLSAPLRTAAAAATVSTVSGSSMGIFHGLIPGSVEPDNKGLWSQADAMVNRLREERRKLNTILEELERLKYMGKTSVIYNCIRQT